MSRNVFLHCPPSLTLSVWLLPKALMAKARAIPGSSGKTLFTPAKNAGRTAIGNETEKKRKARRRGRHRKYPVSAMKRFGWPVARGESSMFLKIPATSGLVLVEAEISKIELASQ